MNLMDAMTETERNKRSKVLLLLRQLKNYHSFQADNPDFIEVVGGVEVNRNKFKDYHKLRSEQYDKLLSIALIEYDL